MTGILNLIIGSLGRRYTIIQTFTATSTWTCPTGVTEVEYLIVGGGASGGKGDAGNGGGGAGGFRTGTGLAVSAGSDYTITVGGGGASQTTQETPGNAGVACLS